MVDDIEAIPPAEYDEAPIADDEVVSAARSCSAILVIAALVGIIACVMFSIALVYG